MQRTKTFPHICAKKKKRERERRRRRDGKGFLDITNLQPRNHAAKEWAMKLTSRGTQETCQELKEARHDIIFETKVTIIQLKGEAKLGMRSKTREISP